MGCSQSSPKNRAAPTDVVDVQPTIAVKPPRTKALPNDETKAGGLPTPQLRLTTSTNKVARPFGQLISIESGRALSAGELEVPEDSLASSLQDETDLEQSLRSFGANRPRSFSLHASELGDKGPLKLLEEAQRQGKPTILQGLSSAEMLVLAHELTLVRFEAGETLIQQGEPAGFFGVVLGGLLAPIVEQLGGEAKQAGTIAHGPSLRRCAVLSDPTLRCATGRVRARARRGGGRDVSLRGARRAHHLDGRARAGLPRCLRVLGARAAQACFDRAPNRDLHSPTACRLRWTELDLRRAQARTAGWRTS
jgi:hypothetical protein